MPAPPKATDCSPPRVTVEVNQKTRMLTDLIEGSDKDLRVPTGALVNSFQSSLKSTFELDATPFDIKGLTTPTKATKASKRLAGSDPTAWKSRVSNAQIFNSTV